jgi:hypothetical protein
MRIVVLTLALVVLCAGQAHAEWQLKPFIGLTFGGGTTFLDNEHAVGDPKVVLGFNGVWLGEFIGVEGDLAFGPGFFEGDHSVATSILVASSSVTTLTGNIVVALPRRVTEYTLRPYFVVGTGLMNVRSISPDNDVLSVRRTLPTVDVGGGATGFLTDRIGVNWDVRYFHTAGGDATIFSIGKEKLSFWRATMAVAFRY